MNLHIEQYGVSSAPSILFLHGLGVSSWMWTDQVEALKGAYHLLTVDLPGNGQSSLTEWQSMADSADQVAAVIQAHANGGRAHIVGLSLGGYTALSLLARHPHLVESMIISGVGSAPLSPRWQYRILTALTIRLMKWKPYVSGMARLMQLPPEARRLYWEDSQHVTRRTLERVYAEVLDYNLPAALSQNTRRLLAAAGTLEVQTMRAGLGRFAALPMTTAVLVPNAHHGWNGEHPALFNAMIRAWVEGQPLPDDLEQVSVSG